MGLKNLEWKKVAKREWHLQDIFYIFSIWLRYDRLSQSYVFGCAAFGIGLYFLKADNAQAAKDEALQVVTKRLESIIEQLKSV